MKKTIIRRVAALFLSLILAVGISAAASASGALGGWELLSAEEAAESGPEARAAFEQAAEGLLGVDYEPLILVARQIVNGTDYCILCRARVVSPDAPSYFSLVYVNADLQGKAKILNIAVLENTGAAGFVPGSWTANDGGIALEDHEDVRSAFDKAMEGLVGAGYEPLAFLSRQTAAGSNYCFLARVTPVVPDARPALAQVYIYADLQGDARLGGVTKLILNAEAEPEESGRSPVLAIWTDEDDGSLVREEFFDESGNCIKEVFYDENTGDIWSTRNCQYDSSGRLAVIEETENDGSVYFQRWEYDKNGNRTAFYDLDENGNEKLAAAFENELDGQGRLVRRISRYTDPEIGFLNSVTVYTYDEEDRVLTEEITYPEGSFSAFSNRTEYVYDEAGNLTEIHTYILTTGEESQYTLQEYNDEGLMIRMTRGGTASEATTWVIEYSYDYPVGLDAYTGTYYTPSDAPAPASVEIQEDGTFVVSIQRLTVIEGEASWAGEGIICLRGTDASGGPIELQLRQEENGFSLTVTDSNWGLLPNDTVFPMAR